MMLSSPILKKVRLEHLNNFYYKSNPRKPKSSRSIVVTFHHQICQGFKICQGFIDENVANLYHASKAISSVQFKLLTFDITIVLHRIKFYCYIVLQNLRNRVHVIICSYLVTAISRINCSMGHCLRVPYLNIVHAREMSRLVRTISSTQIKCTFNYLQLLTNRYIKYR